MTQIITAPGDMTNLSANVYSPCAMNTIRSFPKPYTGYHFSGFMCSIRENWGEFDKGLGGPYSKRIINVF